MPAGKTISGPKPCLFSFGLVIWVLLTQTCTTANRGHCWVGAVIEFKIQATLAHIVVLGHPEDATITPIEAGNTGRRRVPRSGVGRPSSGSGSTGSIPQVNPPQFFPKVPFRVPRSRSSTRTNRVRGNYDHSSRSPSRSYNDSGLVNNVNGSKQQECEYIYSPAT